MDDSFQHGVSQWSGLMLEGDLFMLSIMVAVFSCNVLPWRVSSVVPAGPQTISSVSASSAGLT